MELEVFKDHLQKATELAVTLAKEMLTEDVTLPYQYQLEDRDRTPIGIYSAEEIAEKLFVEGAVPKWINIVVCDVTEQGTVLKVTPSDEFTLDESQMSGADDGAPPFHILAPATPKDIRELFVNERENSVDPDAYKHFTNEHRFSIKDSPTHSQV